ncbi:MAG TPA: DUF58 domain-containing protein [Gemmatimonadaceae bacterium]|jgi:uncharacterized protein (DUF58 family)|nr:DUF58 domain-containing protein [Gemmatimonadaceae bacterium]
MTSSLSPTVVAAIDDLELAARLVVEGMRTGGHRSPFHGFSTEFRQHRPYRLGDDLKHLDWKLYARSDRLYTRQFRETTNLSVLLVLDRSASMEFPDSGVTKFRYAQVLCAALAYLVSDQGHAVGLMTTEGGKLTYIPPRGGRVHLRSLIARLDRLEASNGWDGPQAIARGAQLLQRRGVVLVVSDFYDDEESMRREMRRAAQRGHDVAMLQVLSADELALPFREHVELEDLETGAVRLVDAARVADAYQVAMRSFLDRCRAAALRDGVDYSLFTTATPLEVALRAYLLERAARPPLRNSARMVAR